MTVECAIAAPRDLGAALAPVPGRVGAVHRAPRRAAVDRRDGRATRNPRSRTDNALAPLGAGGSTPRTPTTAACSSSPTTSRCSRPTRRSRRPATTCTAPGARVGTAEVVCYHHDPHEVDGRPRRRRGHRGRDARGATGPRRCRPSTASPTCSSSRTAAPRSARRTRTRTARSTPARWCTAPSAREAEVAAEHHRAHRAQRCSPTSSSASSAAPRVVSDGEHVLRVRAVVRPVRVRGARAAAPAGDVARRPRRRRVPLPRARAARRRPALRRAVGPPHALRARGAPGAGRRPPALSRSTSSCIRRCGRRGC